MNALSIPLHCATPLPPLPQDGMTLACLLDLSDAHADLLDPDATTADFNLAVVMPLTMNSRCSLLEGLKRVGAVDTRTGVPYVGAANIFISHAWLCKWVDLIEALKTFVHSQPDPQRRRAHA